MGLMYFSYQSYRFTCGCYVFLLPVLQVHLWVLSISFTSLTDSLVGLMYFSYQSYRFTCGSYVFLLPVLQIHLWVLCISLTSLNDVHYSQTCACNFMAFSIRKVILSILD